MGCAKVDDFYWYWLSSIPGIGVTKTRRLLSEYGDAKAVYSHDFLNEEKIPYLSENDCIAIEAAKHETQLYEDFCALGEKGIRFVHIQSPDYPKRLERIYEAPIGLYVKGRLPSEDVITVAIVGARGCTEYGRQVAYGFGKSFAYMGIQVISGMALGIDAAGQRGCIDAGGVSVAVLGCGVDVCYPRENIELYTDLVDRGGIVSEYQPQTTPCKGAFPVRNRIISGLSDVVIVVEARKRSGSLITVDLALEQNKEIMAVPGRITDPLSVGCNELIKQGAMALTHADDIRQIEAVQKWVEERSRLAKNNFKAALNGHTDEVENDFSDNSYTNCLASTGQLVYSTVNLYPKDMDTIMKETGLDISTVSSQLLKLQLSGAVKEAGKNCYVRTSL